MLPADLVDPARLMILHEQARQAGYVNGSEADRLNFFAAAAHAVAAGVQNPPGLFATMIRENRWRFLTLADEDAARRKLRQRSELVDRATTAKTGPVTVGEVLLRFPGILSHGAGFSCTTGSSGP